jgi:hypothetical protein
LTKFGQTKKKAATKINAHLGSNSATGLALPRPALLATQWLKIGTVRKFIATQAGNLLMENTARKLSVQNATLRSALTASKTAKESTYLIQWQNDVLKKSGNVGRVRHSIKKLENAKKIHANGARWEIRMEIARKWNVNLEMAWTNLARNVKRSPVSLVITTTINPVAARKSSVRKDTSLIILAIVCDSIAIRVGLWKGTSVRSSCAQKGMIWMVKNAWRV